MSKIERTSLPITDWPDQDRRLWQAATETGRYFQKAGKAALSFVRARLRIGLFPSGICSMRLI